MTRRINLLVLAATLISFEVTGYAQAWVGAPNSLSVDLSYHYADNNGHYGGGLAGSNVYQAEDLDHVKTQTVEVGAEYDTPIKGLAITANVFIMKPKFVATPAIFRTAP